MKKSIPLNPDVLKWARETAGFKVEEVASKMKKDAKVILAWESGEESPTYVQLETLSYDIYKRPIALFFFPEPPQEETPKQSFRTLPEQNIQKMSPRLRFLRRQAQAMRLNLAELHDNANPAENQIVRDLRFTPNVSLHKMVKNVREYLKIPLEIQFQWKDEDEAFKSWRQLLEDVGVFIFKEAFRDKTVSGFCLFDEKFPVIYVNNTESKTRQIFTLFHELAHLLFGMGGIDSSQEKYIDTLWGNDKQIEILCNQFSGSFLVPDEDFDQRILDLSINDESVQNLSNLYSVSQTVILRKLLDRKLISQKLYNNKVEQWEKGVNIKSKPGGNPYFSKRAYLGERYLELVFSHYYQKRISLEETADYLGVSVRSVPGMEALLYDKGVPA
ncbi:MAG: ImmA/IrrE family metallo-endopeptidase [SAR324 cluster bacterium]|nr:ImmA/IrrE family metallo-endopeptidase [SAR324 cluster bacterium]